ncbi:CRISPR-associated helicase Cas3' [Micrococcus luteus]
MTPRTGWSPQALSLWAKTGTEPEDWLDLPRHLTDSAAVGRWLWNNWLADGLRSRLDADLDLRGEGEVFAAWLAGVHDVGKATPAFAAQLMSDPSRSSFAIRIRDAGLPLLGPVGPADWFPHAAGSQVAVKRWLVSEGITRTRRAADALAAIAGAHHGLPSSRPHLRKAEVASAMAPAWAAVQDELLAGMTERLGARALLERVLLVDVTAFHQMLLTGLVIMADWIASNPDLFPLTPAAEVDEPARLTVAMDFLDLTGEVKGRPLAAEAGEAYQASFAWPDGRRPWPVQEDVLRAAYEMEGAGLLCIEAPMGVGKTEAALMAAHVLMERTGRSGAIVAAPTMATSDALFHRVRAWTDRNLGGAGPVSLVLAHSKAALNEEAVGLPSAGMGARGVGLDEAEAGAQSVVAHQWMSGRKKGILASVAVGTVDQVLFMALQSKHMMLRHLGLASKVVVIDECHAYDAYMNQYLARSLQWLGTYGVPVILLSATLPPAVKEELVSAYASGKRGAPCLDVVPDLGQAYPVLTVTDDTGVRAVASPPSGRRSVVRFAPVPDGDATLAELLAPCVAEGGCLVVVCNTVARAQHAYALARDLVGDDAVLMHSRFLARDRVAQESALVAELGPEATRDEGRPWRRIVVATQVVEQSLDLDFDGMITDIAPMDLMLQRSGRVHRHDRPVSDRPEWGRTPQVWVRGADDPGGEQDAPVFDSAMEAVYPAAVLTATWAAAQLHHGGRAISVPDEIPGLVRAVYADDAVVPEGWRDGWAVQRSGWVTKQEESRRRAASFLLPGGHSAETFADLWAGPAGDPATERGEAAGLAQVRDTEPTLEVLLVKAAEGGYVPWGAGPDAEVIFTQQVPSRRQARAVAESSVRLPARFSRPWLFEKALDELESQTDPAWQQSPLLRGQLQLTVDDEGRSTVAGIPLRYDAELGLIDGPRNSPANEGMR